MRGAEVYNILEPVIITQGNLLSHSAKTSNIISDY